ncbi:hypothetical protein [Pseudonocardia asaccharolytica]|uniref:Uncharacterized protein n=1 Tax=Pseudonocardia asaccharolytica DSM 44247 = NBRC 16224 TaxID=1123024 RepID=A0A511CZD7_9PSEU|nr:hypothetical protein [Pseudonocardia asaccharolytica]GEL17905.1 hypothetical protein PA7_17420 [Pseudonocardia asaccharolytica DSM 44247 = NBRC 16224]
MTPTDRVWRSVLDDPLAALESGLPPTDLQTLLIDVARSRARRVSPARVLQRWRDDRFVRPSTTDPRQLAALEARLWELLPGAFAGVELSPVAPLGVCSAVATVDQNRVVTTVRGTEVVSDPTNALAVEAARRRAAGERSSRVDLAACHRVLRAQAFDGPGLAAHFRLFALVSSTRDRGSGTVEAQMLRDHLAVWSTVLAECVPRRRPRLTVTWFGARPVAERFHDAVLPALAARSPMVRVEEDPARTHGRGYYAGAAVGIRAHNGTDEIDLGDGGLTTWTASLLGDAKERCMVSCMSTERLAALSGAKPVA